MDKTQYEVKGSDVEVLNLDEDTFLIDCLVDTFFDETGCYKSGIKKPGQFETYEDLLNAALQTNPKDRLSLDVFNNHLKKIMNSKAAFKDKLGAEVKD